MWIIELTFTGTDERLAAFATPGVTVAKIRQWEPFLS